MKPQVLQDRLAGLAALVLGQGQHPPDDGKCAMEAVAWLAGEPHSDAPACACPVITRAVQSLNDRIADDKTRTEILSPLLPRIVGTRASRDVMVRRGFVAADMAVRVFAPMALEARGRLDLAATLRACAPIVDIASARSARAAAVAAAAAADAAAAAYAAAAAAAADAAAADAADAADAAADAADAAAKIATYRLGAEMISRMIEA
jgi:hypothetical protein